MKAVGRPLEPVEFRSGATAYFACVLVWSTCFWLLSTRVGDGAPESSIVFLVGGAGPLLVALAFTHVFESAATRRDFWRRIVDPRLMSPRWLLVALLLHPAIVAGSVVIERVMGGTWPDVGVPTGGAAALAALVFFTFWFGPLPEEIGWRGFALDRLQRRLSPLTASVVLGTIWACWHLPLFAVPGTFQHALGTDNPRFWVFMASMVPLSVLMTWVYNHARRSTLSAAFVHFSGNLCGALIAKSTRLAAIELVLLTVVAAVVVVSRRGSWLRSIDARAGAEEVDR